MATIEEQETIVNFSRADKGMTVYTTDRTTMTKMDRLCKTSPENYKCVSTDRVNGEIFSRTYKVSDKTLLSFRAKKKTVSEEQRRAFTERVHGTP